MLTHCGNGFAPPPLFWSTKLKVSLKFHKAHFSHTEGTKPEGPSRSWGTERPETSSLLHNISRMNFPMTPWTNLGPLPGSRVHLSLVILMIAQIAPSQPQPTSEQFTTDHLRKDSASCSSLSLSEFFWANTAFWCLISPDGGILWCSWVAMALAQLAGAGHG